MIIPGNKLLSCNMYINITDSETSNNKGSSSELTSYLEKENRLYNKQEPEYWFNHNSQHIEPFEVRRLLMVILQSFVKLMLNSS